MSCGEAGLMMARHWAESDTKLTRAKLGAGLISLFWMTWTASSVVRAESLLLDPARALTSAKRIDFVGRNDFSVEESAQGAMLRSVPHKSASGLYQPVERDGAELTRVRWRWRVDQLQATADVRNLATEDFGAMIMFVFGKPSFLNRDVPTLGYVWTATPIRNGSIVRSQRHQSLAYIQLRGSADIGLMRVEERDVAGDYRNVFGKEPGELNFIAVFNDNDQTNEPASALFGPIVDGR